MAACEHHIAEQPHTLLNPAAIILMQGQLNQALAGVLLGCLEVTMEDVVADAAGEVSHLEKSSRAAIDACVDLMAL